MKTAEIKKTFSIAVPIILGNITQMVLGIIDAAMVGSINSLQIAAAALVNNVLAIPFTLGIGATLAISPLVAIAAGREDSKSASHYLFNGFLLCTLIALGIALGIHGGADILYHLGQEKAVADQAYSYLIIMGYSTLPMLMFLALKQFTDGLEYTRVAMTLSLLSIPLNVGLNYLFIFGKWGFPRWELYGAGIGTLITRTLILLAMILVIVKSEKFKIFINSRAETWKLRMQSWKELLEIGIPSSLQYAMESGAFAFSGIMVGWLGAKQLAAHQIALSIASLTFMISLGLSSAGSIRVSNAFGRGDIEKVRTIGFGVLWASFAYGILCALLFVIFKNQLPLFFNKELPVIRIASILLLWAAVFQISDSVQAIAVGLLRGVKDVRIPTAFVAIAYWVLGIPTGYYLAFVWNWDAIGIWIGFVIGLSCNALFLTLRFNKHTKELLKNQKNITFITANIAKE